MNQSFTGGEDGDVWFKIRMASSQLYVLGPCDLSLYL